MSVGMNLHKVTIQGLEICSDRSTPLFVYDRPDSLITNVYFAVPNENNVIAATF